MSKKAKRYIRFAERTFWGVLLVSVIAIAVLIQIGRLLFPELNNYRAEVEASLSEQLQVNVAIGSLEGEWKGLRPRMSLSDLVVTNPQSAEQIFTIASVEVEVNLLSSLRQWRPAIRKLHFVGLQAALKQDESGKWAVNGMRKKVVVGQPKPASSKPIIDDPLDLFLFGRRISLVDTRLQFDFRNDLAADVTIPAITLENDDDFHRLVADFKTGYQGQSLRLVVEGLGDPRDENRFNSRGYLHLNNFPSAQVLAALGIAEDAIAKNSGVTISDWQQDGLVNMQAWFSGTQYRGFKWSGSVNIAGVPLIPLENAQWPSNIAGQFRGKWAAEEGWNTEISELQVDWPQFSGPRMNAEFIGPVGEQTSLLIDAIDLGLWREAAEQFGWLQGKVGSAFADLSPYGELTRVKLTHVPPEEGHFKLSATIDKAGVNNWAGVPAIEGVSGYIEATAWGGHVALQSFEGFTLNFPAIYNEPLDFQTATGDVRWQVDTENKTVGLSSGLLEVTQPDVSARGYFHLQLPFKAEPGNEPQMTLAIGIEKGFASLHRTLVPFTVPTELYDWLGRSIKSGELEDGAFIYHGTLMKDSELNRSLQLSVHTREAELKFDPRWPELTDASAHLLLDDEHFYVRSLNGDMDGVAVRSGSVSLEHLAQQDNAPALALRGDIACESSRCFGFLKNSPIRDILGEEVMSWELHGEMTGDVKLLVPLDKKADDLAEQQINLLLNNNQLSMPKLDLNFEQVSGRLHYDQAAGLHIEALQANLWSRPVNASVHTIQEGGKPSRIDVDFKTQLKIADLRQWLKRPELIFFSGETAVEGLVSVLSNADQMLVFKANSDLKGVVVDLPEPLGKPANQAAEFDLDLTLSQEQNKTVQDIALHYTNPQTNPQEGSGSGEQHQVKALIRQIDSNVVGVSIQHGGAAPKLEGGAIVLNGDFEQGDGLAWYDAVDAYIKAYDEPPPTEVKTKQAQNTASQSSSQEDLLVKGNYHWDKMNFDSLRFRDLSLAITQHKAVWSFDIDSPDIKGAVDYRDEQHPVLVNLKYLILKEDPPAAAVSGGQPVDTEKDNPDQPSGLGSLDVLSIPAATVSVDSWWVEQRNMGSIRFNLEAVTGGVAAYNLKAELPNSTISGRDGGAELYWLRNEKGDTTYFDGTMTAGDIGPVFTYWDVDEAMTSKSADFNAQIQWPGAPDAIELAKIAGVVDLDLKRGRFIRGAEVGENPIIKLVGLLNFDSLARRLRLDFSDLNPEGLGYETVAGSLIFHSGIVEINQPLKVDMPASQLQMVGLIDVEQELIDAQLVATLPLAGNLTFAAALTGGIPTAVGVFVFGKLFKNQMDKVSSLKYRVYGTWDDPEVKLEHLFADEPKADK